MRPQGSIIIAHRYPLDRLAIAQTLQKAAPSWNIADATNWQELIWLSNRASLPDVIVMDFKLPGYRSSSQLNHLKQAGRKVKILGIIPQSYPVTDRELTRRRLDGAINSRDRPATLSRAFNQVRLGKTWFSSKNQLQLEGMSRQQIGLLSPQEMRVLHCLSEGMMNKHIADHLDIRLNTAKAHVCSILKKLDLQTRTQAALAFQRNHDSQLQKEKGG